MELHSTAQTILDLVIVGAAGIVVLGLIVGLIGAVGTGVLWVVIEMITTVAEWVWWLEARLPVPAWFTKWHGGNQ